MECPNCKKNIDIPRKAYINLESYKVGGSVLVSSDCCGAGYIVNMQVSYKLTPYTGENKEDDWGVKLTKNTNF